MNASDYCPVTAEIVTALKTICGDAFVHFDDERILEKYSRDKVPETYGHMPEVVVLPKTAQEIVEIVKLANREMIPITPRAAGSGLSGGAVPIFGGILLSIERMNTIIEIDDRNLMAVVEPGVVTNTLDERLLDHGLFFAGYPMSEEFCFIGGNVAENAGGGRAVKYGVTGQYIKGLEVVTPTGDRIQLGGKRIKDVTGYDMVQLMVGSEGTLGIFTKIFIRLLPRPTVRQAILVLFEDPETAIAVVPEVMTSGGLVPTSIEFMDGFTFSMTAKARKESFPYESIGAALLFEVDGNHVSVVAEDAATIRRICRERGAIAEYPAVTDREIERFWRIRKQIPWDIMRYTSHQSIEDISVPIANIPLALSRLKQLGEKYGVGIPVLGHAGDGNLHAVPLKHPDDSVAHWEEVLPDLLNDMYIMTAELGGTISGEHGIGHKRRDYMGLVMSDAQINMMRKIKSALDPNHILNPGKIFSRV
ncbi:FAD/FMN-containing dehydrogenase [Olavius algarvensis associated proteobacterium Delta 3]|nr:FAD/FMN-containing dehydrogenase [Olavius algarvensis associated proteobacterium Delta 3]CAB5147717.1 FAD/FMN-containing dehydrogenase [Olavius algarvensis associated proteobacterium Delta 3]